MDPYKTNGGAGAQSDVTPQSEPPPFEDPNPTRYIPPQGTVVPDISTGGQYQSGDPQAQQAQSTSTQPNAAGTPPSYQYINQSTVPYSITPAQRRDRDRSLLAIILIGAGVLFLLSQFSFFPGFGDMVLLLLGGIFMYAYFTTKPGYRIGFLIPGAILSGLGVGQFISDLPGTDLLFGGSIIVVTLGLGFCAIWFFERKHWWALIPGGIILLAGLSSVFRVGALWPVILIGLGIYLLYEQTRRKH